MLKDIYTDLCPSLGHSPRLHIKSLIAKIYIKIDIKAELFKILWSDILIFKIFELILEALVKKTNNFYI
jgi:hypothetical protein